MNSGEKILKSRSVSKMKSGKSENGSVETGKMSVKAEGGKAESYAPPHAMYNSRAILEDARRLLLGSMDSPWVSAPWSWR